MMVFFLSLFMAGCEDIKHFFGVQKPKQEIEPKNLEASWEPDRSQPFNITGNITEKGSGQPLQGVEITAQYTISCPTKECNPFTETIAVKTDSGGFYNLELYQNFWDITIQKSKYNIQEIHITKEQASQNPEFLLDIELEKGVFKELQAFIRDQGKRMIIDKGSLGGFPLNLGEKTYYFQYLKVINSPESDLYNALLMNHNRQVKIQGYVFIAKNNQGLIEVTSFTPIA